MLSGEMVVYYGSAVSILHAGDHCVFAPGEAHRAEFPKDTVLFGITIPDTEDYPHGGTKC